MSAQILKFIRDKSVTSDPLKLIQWDNDGDLAYVPNDNADWNVVPTGALQAIDELAARTKDLEAGGVIQAKVANFNAANGFIYITTGAISAQLPAPAVGTKIIIKKTDNSTVTILRNGAENIEGAAASFLLTSTRQAVTLISDGTNWFII
jgi:hypothetical protein